MNDNHITTATHPSHNAIAKTQRFQWLMRITLLLALCIGAMNMAHAMDKKTRNVLIGAGIGAVGGSVLSGGDTWSTIGGAALGGVVGHVATKDDHNRDDDRRRWERDHRNDRNNHVNRVNDHRDPRYRNNGNNGRDRDHDRRYNNR